MRITIQAVDPQGNAFHVRVIDSKDCIISNLKPKEAKDVFISQGKFEKIHDYVFFLSESAGNNCEWRFAE